MMFQQIRRSFLLLTILLLLTGCKTTSAFTVCSEIQYADAEILVAAPQEDQDLLDNMSLSAYQPMTSLLEFFTELRVLREDIAPSFGGIVYDDEQVMIYTTVQDEDTMQLYWDALDQAKPYPKTGLVACDYTLDQLYETFAQMETLQHDWLRSVQLDVRANRIAIYVSKWNRRIEKTLLAAITEPDRCIIVRAKPAASEVTIIQNPAPRGEEHAVCWQSFIHQAEAAHLSEDEKLNASAHMIIAVRNHMLFYPADSWQSKLLSDWQLIPLAFLGWLVKQQDVDILVYYPWEERYTALLKTACASVPEAVFFLSIPPDWQTPAVQP